MFLYAVGASLLTVRGPKPSSSVMQGQHCLRFNRTRPERLLDQTVLFREAEHQFFDLDFEFFIADANHTDVSFLLVHLPAGHLVDFKFDDAVIEPQATRGVDRVRVERPSAATPADRRVRGPCVCSSRRAEAVTPRRCRRSR